MAKPPAAPPAERDDPCPIILDPDAGKKLADYFGFKGIDRSVALRMSKDVNYFVTRAFDMAFAMRKHPIASQVVKVLLAQGDRARTLGDHFGKVWQRDVKAAGGPESPHYQQFHNFLMDMEGRKQWYTDKEIAARKLSPEAARLARTYRHLMPRALGLINIVRHAQGLDPIEGIQGVFFPHEMNGNFHLEIDGKKLITPHGSAWDTQADAYEAARQHMLRNPKDVGRVSMVADYTSKLQYAILPDPSQFGELNATLNAVARGSGISADRLGQAFKDGLQVQGFKTHILPRKGRPGWDSENTHKVITNYLNMLPWWAAAEKGRVTIRDALAGKIDPKTEPHVVLALQRYLAQVYGIPGGVEIALDQIITRTMQSKPMQLVANAIEPLEANPLVRPVARALNPRRFNPGRPTMRLTQGARALTADLKMGNFGYGVMLTHLLHMPTVAFPTLGPKYMALGIRDLFEVPEPWGRRVYGWGDRHHVFRATLTDDMPGGPLSKMFEKAFDKAGANELARETGLAIWRPITLSERWLRQAIFFGAYRALKDGGATGEMLLRLASDDTMKAIPELHKFHERMTLEMAKRVTELVANRYDRASRPWWTTGPVGGLVGQFKTFLPDTIALERRIWDLGGTNRYRAVAPLGMMLLLGGAAGGIPFAHQLDDLTRFITGRMDPEGRGGISPLDSTYMMLRHELGEPAAEAAFRGIPAYYGMDITRRVGFSHLHFEGPKDIAGAFASTMIDTMAYAFFHDLEAAPQISPGLGNIAQAYEWQRDQMMKDQYHRDRMRFAPSQLDINLRMLGIEPLNQAKRTDIRRITERQKEARTKAKSYYVDAMIEAMKQDDDKGYAALQAQATREDIHVSLADLDKEIAAKKKTTLHRAKETLPKAMRPWFEREFAPELQEDIAGEQRAEQAAAQRALENAQHQHRRAP